MLDAFGHLLCFKLCRHNRPVPREEMKVHICLFSCAITRAVHLKVVTDLTVETFLLAFRRFCSRKSLPKKMISDNASTYLAAAEELQRMFSSEALKEALESQNVTWHFIPKRAPMVRRILGTYHWINQAGGEEDTWQNICYLKAA